MPGERFDFGQVTSLDAEAIGPPGQRRFRMTALGDDSSASLWLEKEQLAALATAMEQQLVRVGRARPGRQATEDEPSSPFPLNPSLDLQVVQLALGYDDEHALFVIQAFGADAPAEGRATFACTITHDQARRLLRQIARLMSSGRPVCPLCGAIIEGEHHCPRSNGHAQVSLR